MSDFIKISKMLINLGKVDMIVLEGIDRGLYWTERGMDELTPEECAAVQFYFESQKTPDIMLLWTAEQHKRLLEKRRAEWGKKFEQFRMDNGLGEIMTEEIILFREFLTANEELREPDESALREFRNALRATFERMIERLAGHYKLNQEFGERFRSFLLDMNVRFPNYGHYDQWYTGLAARNRPNGVREGEQPYKGNYDKAAVFKNYLHVEGF